MIDAGSHCTLGHGAIFRWPEVEKMKVETIELSFKVMDGDTAPMEEASIFFIRQLIHQISQKLQI
jgi:hypothetical protein